MKPLLLVVLIFGTLGHAQAQGTTGSGKVPGQAQQGQQGTVEIVAPKAGVRLSQDFVTVRYQMPPQATADPSPTFLLRLDDRDPIRTMASEYTFSGLQPGQHRLSVELVDANDTPVAGTRSQIDFVVAGNRGTQRLQSEQELQSASTEGPELVSASMPQPETGAAAVAEAKEQSILETREAAGPQLPGDTEPVKSVEPPAAAGAPGGDLPGTASHLPLLSLIGLGVLVGGVAATLKNGKNRGGA